MRWGVGKGRFRNLTATILCVFLALSFVLMWSFYRHIDPLTIDTSPRSQYASIGDRLINTQVVDSSQLSQTDVLLFCRIADSVQSIFDRAFPLQKTRAAKWQSDTLPERLRQTQVLTRATIAFMLNQNFSTIAQYRRCEGLVLSIMHSDEKKQLRHHDVYSTALAKAAMDSTQRTHQHQTMSVYERELLQEFSHELQEHLLPFELGLSSDSLSYPDLAKKLFHSGGSL